MYQPHPSFKFPANENVKIWRYMDFTKFVSMLDQKSLYFSRADQLGDPFECAYPKANGELLARETEILWERVPMADDEKRTLIAKLESGNRNSAWSGYSLRLHSLFINCWHMNEYESAAMWKIYLKSVEGIAVQSTARKLIDAVASSEERVFIGEVTYIDYNTQTIPWGNDLNYSIHKRISFEHERELRAVVWTFELNESDDIARNNDGTFDFERINSRVGFHIPTDLSALVEKIYIAPTAPHWLHGLVESVLERYQVGHFPVVQSSLAELPLR